MGQSRQMTAILSKTIWNLELTCPDFEWSSFWMIGTIAIAKDIADHLKTGPFEIQRSNGKISDLHCIRHVRYSDSHFIYFNYAFKITMKHIWQTFFKVLPWFSWLCLWNGCSWCALVRSLHFEEASVKHDLRVFLILWCSSWNKLNKNGLDQIVGLQKEVWGFVL